MQTDEIRFVYAYDQWATRQVLSVLDGLDPEVWRGTHAVGDRGLGAILVHHLGASRRWRPLDCLFPKGGQRTTRR
jgi:uncharacterized damage-inducible protein DinB